MSDDKKPLKLALHGFDLRGSKTLVMYLAMFCKNIAEVVTSPEEAEADVFDFDIKTSKTLFESHLQENLTRPVIVFSLSDSSREEIFHIKKPVNADNMMQILAKAKTLARSFTKPVKTETAAPSPAPEKTLKKSKTQSQKTENNKTNVSKSGLNREKPDNAEKVLPDSLPKEPKTNGMTNEQTSARASEAEYIMESLDDWFDL